MIRVSVMYPRQDGGTFNFDYYLKSHIPMAKKLVGAAMKKVEVYKGAGAPGGAPETYVAVASLFFDSVDSFGAAFGPVAGQIMADVANYTNVQPVVQIEQQLL